MIILSLLLTSLIYYQTGVLVSDLENQLFFLKSQLKLHISSL